MSPIVDVFGPAFAGVAVRTTSYDLLRNVVLGSHNWQAGGSPDTPRAVARLEAKLKGMTKAELAFLICHTGYIPEEYEHDSSEETLYSKLVEAVEKKEKNILAQIAKGTLDRSWVDQALRAKGVLK